MPANFSNQVDLAPASAGNTTGLHAHVSNGASASGANNPSDFPAPLVKGTTSTQITVKTVGARYKT